MEKDRPLTREEIEDILDRLHIEEYEWYIDDEEDDHFCSSSEEDAELVEKAIKGLISQYNNDYISKDKIRDKIKKLKIECNICELGKAIDCNSQCTIGGTIAALKELLEE